ncbi:LEM domain-containing protein 1 isoform X2 [Salmo salar]|uniref:LEM domain-containing protein 1 isoform X2 n=1 Tax=Salmo salar TaxID=8030 RepID=A0A1S3MG10_SALSA|nr:LEM domain-containing protein 1 isoform X2 [Salmo salar]|eukprot:XP_014002004.1 PREDICTED: lamina-associated polypeptide 2, isoforms beta/gamma-like isoform X2 [Salmo salar]
MPVFVEDPAQFSKPRLKSELIAHNVTLPAVESKKQVYVELYLKHIVQKSAADFSSDEEDDDVVEVQDSQDFEEEEKDPEMLDPSVLTDDKLKTTLLKYGVEAGPIVATTRSIYERKLQRLLKPAQPRQNGGTGDADQYSDSEGEEETGSQQGSPETVSLMEENLHVDMWFESRIPLSSSGPEIKRGNNRSSNQGPCPRPYWEAATVDKYTMTNRSLFITPKTSLFKRQIKEPVTDVLMEMFPETEPTPTGIAATRRRPIKGAAGRPVQFKYPDLPASPMTLQRWAVEPRLVPLWVQILVFFIVACLLYLIYASMEDGLANPFVALLDNLSMETETEGLSLQAEP